MAQMEGRESEPGEPTALARIIVAGGLPSISAPLMTLVASLRTGNLPVAMLLGVTAAALMEVVR